MKNETSICALHKQLDAMQEQLDYNEDIIAQMSDLIDGLRFQLENEQQYRKEIIKFLECPQDFTILENDDTLPF